MPTFNPSAPAMNQNQPMNNQFYQFQFDNNTPVFQPSFQMAPQQMQLPAYDTPSKMYEFQYQPSPQIIQE